MQIYPTEMQFVPCPPGSFLVQAAGELYLAKLKGDGEHVDLWRFDPRRKRVAELTPFGEGRLVGTGANACLVDASAPPGVLSFLACPDLPPLPLRGSAPAARLSAACLSPDRKSAYIFWPWQCMQTRFLQGKGRWLSRLHPVAIRPLEDRPSLLQLHEGNLLLAGYRALLIISLSDRGDAVRAPHRIDLIGTATADDLAPAQAVLLRRDYAFVVRHNKLHVLKRMVAEDLFSLEPVEHHAMWTCRTVPVAPGMGEAAAIRHTGVPPYGAAAGSSQLLSATGQCGPEIPGLLAADGEHTSGILYRYEPDLEEVQAVAMQHLICADSAPLTPLWTRPVTHGEGADNFVVWNGLGILGHTTGISVIGGPVETRKRPVQSTV